MEITTKFLLFCKSGFLKLLAIFILVPSFASASTQVQNYTLETASNGNVWIILPDDSELLSAHSCVSYDASNHYLDSSTWVASSLKNKNVYRYQYIGNCPSSGDFRTYYHNAKRLAVLSQAPEEPQDEASCTAQGKYWYDGSCNALPPEPLSCPSGTHQSGDKCVLTNGLGGSGESGPVSYPGQFVDGVTYDISSVVVTNRCVGYYNCAGIVSSGSHTVQINQDFVSTFDLTQLVHDNVSIQYNALEGVITTSIDGGTQDTYWAFDGYGANKYSDTITIHARYKRHIITHYDNGNITSEPTVHAAIANSNLLSFSYTIYDESAEEEEEPDPNDPANNTVYACEEENLPESWWETEYPDGISGLFDEKYSELEDSPLFSIMDLDMPSYAGGTVSFDMCFTAGSTFDFGCHSAAPLPYVFTFIRLCILITAAWLCRALIFGG